MGIIITAARGSSMNPAFQVNGDVWPMRTNGCLNTFGECVWSHSCKRKSIKCMAKILTDEYTLRIAGDIVYEIYRFTGRD